MDGVALCKALSKDGSKSGKRRDVWKLYLFAGSAVGAPFRQNTVNKNQNRGNRRSEYSTKKNTPPQIYLVGSDSKHYYDVCGIDECLYCKGKFTGLVND